MGGAAAQPVTPGSGSTSATSTTSPPGAPAGGLDLSDGNIQGTSLGDGFTNASINNSLAWRVETFRQQVAQGASPDLANVRDATVTTRTGIDESTGFGQRSSRTNHQSTIGSLLADLATWSKPEIEAMQQKLLAGGYYPRSYYEGTTKQTIVDGVLDGDLRSAYALLLSDAVLAVSKPLDQVLNERIEDFGATGRLAAGGRVRQGEFSAGQSHTIALDDPEALRKMIDEVAVTETGQAVDPKFRDSLVTLLRTRDKNEQQRVINADEAQRHTNFDAAVGQAKATSTFDRGITADTISPEQEAIAKQIIDVGKMRGESNDAIVAAVATGMYESHLTNLPGGDADSQGVFQQRPSQGWKGLQDVTKAAEEFFDHYAKAEGANAAEKAANVQKPRKDLRGGYAANYTNAIGVVAKVTGEDLGVMPITDGSGSGSTPDTFVPSSTVVADRIDPRADAEAAVREHDPAGYGAHEVANQYQSFRKFLGQGAS